MWYKVFYTNFSIPKKFAAMTRGPFVLIRPDYKQDKGLLEHELIHVKQWWKNPLFHALRYKFSTKYRLQCELEAYKHQLKFYENDNIYLFASYIVNKYKVNSSLSEVVKLLQKD
jgi:hypothetical protein